MELLRWAEAEIDAIKSKVLNSFKAKSFSYKYTYSFQICFIKKFETSAAVRNKNRVDWIKYFQTTTWIKSRRSFSQCQNNFWMSKTFFSLLTVWQLSLKNDWLARCNFLYPFRSVGIAVKVSMFKARKKEIFIVLRAVFFQHVVSDAEIRIFVKVI